MINTCKTPVTAGLITEVWCYKLTFKLTFCLQQRLLNFSILISHSTQIRTNSQSSHHVVQIDEGVVDGDHLDLASWGGGAGHQTADTSESETQEDEVSVIKQLQRRFSRGWIREYVLSGTLKTCNGASDSSETYSSLFTLNSLLSFCTKQTLLHFLSLASRWHWHLNKDGSHGEGQQGHTRPNNLDCRTIIGIGSQKPVYT